MNRRQLAMVLFLLGAVLIGVGLRAVLSSDADEDAKRWIASETARAEQHVEELAAPGEALMVAAEELLEDVETVVPEDEFWARLHAGFGEAHLPEQARLEIYRPVTGNVGAMLVGAVTRAGVYNDDPMHRVDGVGTLLSSILGPEMRMLQEGEDEVRPDLIWFSQQDAGVMLHRLRPILAEFDHDEEEHDEHEEEEHEDEDHEDEHEEDEHEHDEDEHEDDDEALRPYLVHFVTPMRAPKGMAFAYLCEQSDSELTEVWSLVVPSSMFPLNDATPVVLEAEVLDGRYPTSSEEPRLEARIAAPPTPPLWPLLLVVVGVLAVGSVIFLGGGAQAAVRLPAIDLTSEAAHEMRTPLTVMRGKLEVALRRERDPAYYRQTIAECLEEVSALEQLQDAVLLLGRTRRADLVQEDIDLRAIADAEVSRVAEAHPERDVSLTMNGPVIVQGDPSLLARAIGNLIDNAANHSIDGGAIRVTVGSRGGKARIVVEDAGPGVPPERHESVFERFYRGPDVGRRGIAGSGLGLPIVRRIAELHGGTAAIEPADGAGRFVLVLPST